MMNDECRMMKYMNVARSWNWRSGMPADPALLQAGEVEADS
jgi:hypothetical protein